MKEFQGRTDKIPEISCRLRVCCDRGVDECAVINDLRNNKLNIFSILRPLAIPQVCFDIAFVQNKSTWEMDDVLAELLDQVDGRIEQIKNIASKYQAEIMIDISFWQYGTYPALIFDGENMKKIHLLDANMSIDIFDGAE